MYVGPPRRGTLTGLYFRHERPVVNWGGNRRYHVAEEKVVEEVVKEEVAKEEDDEKGTEWIVKKEVFD